MSNYIGYSITKGTLAPAAADKTRLGFLCLGRGDAGRREPVSGAGLAAAAATAAG